MFCGGGGMTGNLSVMTCLGGGGMTLPGIVINSGAKAGGGAGGLSRTIIGGGAIGCGGLCLTWSGGAGAA